MSKAREEDCKLFVPLPSIGKTINDYVSELEHELCDSELRRKDLLTSLQDTIKQKDKLEQEKINLLKAITEINENNSVRWIHYKTEEVLQKYSKESER